jgi:hypothetical protein
VSTCMAPHIIYASVFLFVEEDVYLNGYDAVLCFP